MPVMMSEMKPRVLQITKKTKPKDLAMNFAISKKSKKRMSGTPIPNNNTNATTKTPPSGHFAYKNACLPCLNTF